MTKRFHPSFPHRGLGALAMGFAIAGPALAQDAPPSAFAVSKPAPAVTVPTHAASWSLSLPTTEPVTFKGIANHDEAGIGAAPMLYPTQNLAGTLVAVLAHAAISESAKSSQKAQLQRNADAVLNPYRPILATLTHAELLRRLPVSPARSPGQPAAWRVESKPVFSLTRDARALILENEVSVYRSGTQAASYQNIVKAVSQPVQGGNPLIFWSADDGKRLRSETASLLHESVELAVAAANGTLPSAAGQETHRYMEGSTEKVERAELLSNRCGRVLLRTLRSTLLLVRTNENAERCAVQPAPGSDGVSPAASN